MFCRILTVFMLTVFHFSYETEGAPAVVKSKQFLPPMPGYIPVYIRAGNTPLEDINAELAEAFRAYARKQARLNSARARSHNILTDDNEKRKNEELDTKRAPANKEENSFGLDNFDLDENDNKVESTENTTNQHIQKIKPKF